MKNGTRLGELADWLLRDRRWEAARGFELTDEVRAVVAAHAVLPILGLDESWYDGVGAIIVRDGSMTQRHTAGPIRGTFERSPQAVDGESHHGDGPLMVSWRAARREAANPRFGRDVVLHEFAHKIDMHDGVLDGTPLLPDDDERQRWVDICTPRYEAVRDGDPASCCAPTPAPTLASSSPSPPKPSSPAPSISPSGTPTCIAVFAAFYRQDPASRAAPMPSGPGPSSP